MHAEETAKAILALPRKQLLLVARAHNEVKPRGEKKIHRKTAQYSHSIYQSKVRFSETRSC